MVRSNPRIGSRLNRPPDEEYIDGRGNGEDILTTLDKVRICLNNYRNFLRWQNDWFGEFSLLLTILLALLTADFRDTFNIASIYWKYSISFLFIVLAIRYLFKFINFLIYINGSKIENFVNELRSGSLEIRDAPSIGKIIASKTSSYLGSWLPR